MALANSAVASSTTLELASIRITGGKVLVCFGCFSDAQLKDLFLFAPKRNTVEFGVDEGFNIGMVDA